MNLVTGKFERELDRLISSSGTGTSQERVARHVKHRDSLLSLHGRKLA